MYLPLFDSVWMEIKDGNAHGRELFGRHYSKHHYKDGRKPKLFVGPGEKLVLITPACDALFAWRKFIDASGQTGINCSVFRNESKQLSSMLILEAEKWALSKWGSSRLYTYVNAKKIKSANPGYCFKVAGWNQCGITKTHKLIILEKYITT